MSAVRRRVLRSVQAAAAVDSQIAARQNRRRARLAKEKLALKRWLSKLKRAMNTVTALHQSILRLEALLNH